MYEAVLLRSLVFVARGREAGDSLCGHRQTSTLPTALRSTGGYVNRVLQYRTRATQGQCR
jgi:hypothetical protein